MITYPISSNFCNVIGFTIFHFLEAATRGVLEAAHNVSIKL